MSISTLTAPARRLDLGIVGAGTAGSAAALLLSRAGHRVTLYERVPEPGAVGAGIMLQPTGMHVLARLGLLDDVLARGARVERLYATSGRDWPVLDLNYGMLTPGLFGLGLHRGVLFDALFSEVRRSGIALKCGVSVARIQRTSGRPELLDASGAVLGAHDLVVVADGARSHLRESAISNFRTRPYPWGALWFVGEDREQHFTGTLRQHVRATDVLLGFLPTGRGPGTSQTPLVSLFWGIRNDRVDAFRHGDLDAWKRTVLAIAPAAEGLLAQIHSADALTHASYWDIRMPRWDAGDVVILGDAAHATSPQLGQGANLALVDAMVLADALDEPLPLPDALTLYSKRRRSHLRFYQAASRGLTPLFQSDHRWLGPFRDLGMSIACRLPWVRAQMVASMAGVKTGFVLGRVRLGEPRAMPALVV